MTTVDPAEERGDRASFEAFFRRDYPSVYAGLLMTFRDPEVAAEGAEEAFARAWIRWGRVRRMDHPRAWAARVGFNHVVKQRFRWKRELEQHRPTEDPTTPPPDRDVDRRIDLKSILGELSDRQRAVLVLRFYLDLSTKDAAKALGVTEGTVKRHCSDALRRLAREHAGGSRPGEPVSEFPLDAAENGARQG